jgi:hypothetical protein
VLRRQIQQGCVFLESAFELARASVLNTALTPFWYHFAMGSGGQNNTETRTGNKAGILLAFSLAVGLHFALLLIPIVKQTSDSEATRAPIELQLTTTEPKTTTPSVPIPEPEQPEPIPDPIPPEPMMALEEPVKPAPTPVEPPEEPVTPVASNLQPDLNSLSAPEKKQLANTILSRQFFTEESEADKIFGRPIVQQSTEIQKDFHYPLSPNMLTMLDQPLPEVPFAYTPDLVYFAYDPGVRGDLQRFWDVITPEFGWRTKYGTEVKCILVLVIVGCGWK